MFHDMVNYNVAVVVPAAGQSVRMNGECPKQYFPIMGKALFMYCVEAFARLDVVTKICVVSDRVQWTQQLLDGFSEKTMVVAGGSSRHASIRNGLDALHELGCSFRVVVVHDGARPIVPEQFLKDLIVEADRSGAAGATRPLTSTVLRPGVDGCVDECLHRGSLVASETPQAFLFEMLYNVYQMASDEDIEHGTECLALVLKYRGVRAKLMPGPDTLWKVTEKKDYYASTACLRELWTRVLIISEVENDLVSALKNSLLTKVRDVAITTPNHKVSSVYNTLILFHYGSFKQYEPSEHLGTNSLELIIHVTQSSTEKREDLVENHRVQQKIHQENSPPGVVVIYITSPNQDEFLRLITSIILNDSDLFSGQTLFL